MRMVSHQNIGMDLATMPLTDVYKDLQIVQIIRIIYENDVVIIATLNDMLWLSG
jgi:hypothetical protein